MSDKLETQKNQDSQDKYAFKLKTKENNKMDISIGYIDSKLSIIAAFYKNYFKKTFSNSFTLGELKESSSYYKQFNNEKEVIKEIVNNKLKGQEKIEGNEETSNIINLEIPLPSSNFSKISFELKLVNKTPEEVLNEYKYVINQYESNFKITNFNSKILAGKDLEKETIKMWIYPRGKLEAKLLFSFHDIKYNGYKNKYTYTLNEEISVQKFHKECDYKNHILIICKSKNEIFGGYTPLGFNSFDEYGKDNDSFLFSLNKLQKYPKDSYNDTESLWCYKNYGPCFHWDLYFREKKMHAVKFEKKNYLTPEKWIDKDNCYVNEEGILLDSLEVFQIFGINDINYSYYDFFKYSPFSFLNIYNGALFVAGNIIKKNNLVESDKKISNKNDKKSINKDEKSKNENSIDGNKNDIAEKKSDIEEKKNDIEKNKNDIKEN